MNVIVRTAVVIGVVLATLVATPAFAATPTELHIAADGKVSAKNILVYQKSGTALFCRATWGNAFVRMTVLTQVDGVAALVVRNHGGTTTVDEIQQGDLISLEGFLTPAADSLQINATRITDTNLNKEPKALSGVIKTINIASGSFVLPNKTFGNTTVLVGTSTITKGARTIVAAELKAGDKVLALSGTYDYATNTLTANTITVFQDKSVFLPRTFSGTIRAMGATTLPTMLTISTATADYQVYLSATAKVMSKNRSSIDLSRMQLGDKVMLYGSIRPTNLDQLDAATIRDLNF